MSAGGLSYDCLTTSRKTTLPSVEMWGTNMNILRDPPASLYTRRKDKVGDTQEVLLAQEAAGDRISENINVYARGVNPMVSVSYDNYGNNAGTRTSIVGGGRAVKLPYRPEVFRPPVFRQEDITPLSRLPRNYFYALSNPESLNVVAKMDCDNPKNAVWSSEKMLRPEASVRIQYNNEMPTLDSTVKSSGTGCLKQQVLTPDRHAQTQEIREEQIWMNQHHDPKNVHRELLRGERVAPSSIESVGDARDIFRVVDPKKIQHNKLLYQMFANKSGNKNLSQDREMIQTIQTRALHNGPLAVQSIEDNIVLDHLKSGIDGAYYDSSEKSFGSTLNRLIQRIETSSQVAGPFESEGSSGTDDLEKRTTHSQILQGETPTQLSSPFTRTSPENNPDYLKGSGNDYLYKEVMTGPTKSLSGPSIENSSTEGRGSKAVHDQVLSVEHVAGRRDPVVDNSVPHSALGKAPHRSLPQVFSRTNQSGLYRNGNPEAPDHLGGGKIETDFRTTHVESAKSIPSLSTSIEKFQNAPVSVRENMLHTSATSASTMDRASLTDVIYNDTSMPQTRLNLPPVEATAPKTFFEKTDWFGEKTPLQRRHIQIETSTHRDNRATGHDLYGVQSTNPKNNINRAPNAGSFDPQPACIPRLHREGDHGSEMPVSERYTSLKNKASRAYFDRFEQPMP